MGADPVPFGSRIETSCCAYIRITYMGKPQVGTLVNHSSSDVQSRLVALREQLTSPIPDYNLDCASISAIIASVEQKGRLLCETLENCITDMNSQALDKISSSKEAKAIGFTDLIDLHLLLTRKHPSLISIFQSK